MGRWVKQKIKGNDVSPAREAALDELVRLDARRGDFDADEVISLSSKRDHRLVKEYVQGIMRYRRRLDFIIGSFYNGVFESMESSLQWVLRLGAYDLLYLRTPSHAAINEAVELAKKRVRKKAGGLVNGILRSVDRQREELPEPKNADHIEKLGITYSHPNWMVERWVERYADDVEELLAWNNKRPEYSIRINTLNTSPASFKEMLNKDEIEWSDGRYLDDFIRLPRLQNLLRNGYLKKGLCAVQDESMGLIVRLLDPQPGEHIVDACAAPGGKTLYIADLMKGEGVLKALDVQENRMRRLKGVLNAYGAEWIHTEVADLRIRSPQQLADRVLLDVPCSGLGVLAKRADLRWNRKPQDLQTIIKIQAELLNAAATWVNVGGTLVYSTCTIEPEENENQIQAFLERSPGFVVEKPEWPPSLVTSEGFLKTVPHRHHVDGAFGARLRRVRSD